MWEQLKKLWRSIRKSALFCILCIVIVVVLVMPTLIAVSTYLQSEAISCLAAIHTAEKSHYALYESWSDSFDGIGWEPIGQAKYAYFLTPSDYIGKSADELGLTLPVNFEDYGAPEPGMYENGFVAVAIGNIDWDETFDVWWIDQDKKPMNSQDDVFSWRTIINGIKKVVADFI